MGVINTMKKIKDMFKKQEEPKQKNPRLFMRGVLDVEYGIVAKFYREKILKTRQEDFGNKYGIARTTISSFERCESNSDETRDAYEKSGILKWARTLPDEVIIFLSQILSGGVEDD